MVRERLVDVLAGRLDGSVVLPTAGRAVFGNCLHKRLVGAEVEWAEAVRKRFVQVLAGALNARFGGCA